MIYEVIPTEKFENDLKFYIAKRKFYNITDDIDTIIQRLENGDLIGDAITDVDIPTENKTYKVRVANSDTKVGKSNGYRMIYYAITDELKIYLLTVYYKKDDNSVLNKNEIAKIIKTYCL